MTLPVALSGADVIGQAKTGTGKTLGFGLPLLDRVTVPADVEAGRAKPEDLTDTPQALVVVPTRELCTQVTNDLLTAGKVRNVRVTAIYGGRAYEPQVEALKKGVDVIVGTPGRLLDLAGQKKLNLKDVKALVLDEADEMLDLGFLPDVEKIINLLPTRRQTMLFSATMPGAVIGLARRYMSQPTHISATSPDDEGATVANTTQFIYRAHNMDKPEMVSRILQADGRGLVMVFCRTKRTAADLADQLKQRGFASGAVHGDLGQGAREQALRAFRNGKVDVLVCTDVAARGIDVEGVTHVINYQSPEDEKTYLHRIGRTGRAGAKGTAITLVDWDDIPRWQLINKALDLGFSDPPETYSTSPHLFTDLGIPERTKGVLPRSERIRAGLDAEEVEDLGEPGGRGPRGRGGRGDRSERSERGDRGERGDSRSADHERPARTPRRRRRTRGGTPLSESAQQPTAPAVEGTGESTGEAEAGTASRTPRRRRRMRGGAAAEATTAPVTAVEPADAAADAAVAAAEGTTGHAPQAPEALEAPSDETSSKPRRRRSRRSAETAADDAAADAAVAVAVAPSAGNAAPTGTAPVIGEPEAPAAEAPATEPRRRRTRKSAAATAPSAAEAVVDTAEVTTAATPEPVETKPRRTRKSVARAPEAAAAEAVLDAAEGTEAKPRRRTRKAAATAEATTTAAGIPIPAQAASEAEPEAAVAAKPRRTRKAAATAETAVDTAEAAEAKPRVRRTRKAAAATQQPEAAPEVPAVTTAEAKPKRTRKTAAAKTVDTAEAAEAKPRRTRKATTATADTAGIPAQAASAAGPETAGAKPRVRRTRKAAVTAPAEPTEA
ncbi:DEAD/DEAH box helicase [Streptomyces sp. NPDC058632]|uniref:DEAD/DEAH box helicase n=1 Tax=unclassified Streptomyces TaxID=2593676 RepID=UPI003658100A